MPIFPSPSHGTVFVRKRSPVEREAICATLGWAGLHAHPIDAIDEMLSLGDLQNPACLVTDLPETTPEGNLEFRGVSQRELESTVEHGNGSVDSHTLVICAACLSDGGCHFAGENLTFLKRPYTRGQLLEAIVQAFSCDAAHQKKFQEKAQILSKIDSLTPRERQVMHLIYEGLPNKTIAIQLTLSTRTVESTRSTLFRKMEVDSAISLVRQLAQVEDSAFPDN